MRGWGGGVDSGFFLQSFSFWPEFAPTALGATELHGGGQPLSENYEVTSFAVGGLKTSGLGEYEVIPLSDTRKELFLQNHNPLSHCFPVIMEQIFQELITLLCGNHTEPISPYPRRALF